MSQGSRPAAVRSSQYDLNEQLKQELMILEGEIRSTQEVLTSIR